MQKFIDLMNIISRLRAPDGCPWDQKQTPDTFKPYIIEEAHELIEAVEHNDTDHVREELGDMLFQIAFMCNLYNEAGHFTMDDVLESIIEKMVRRHPHVFADTKVTSEEELRRQWNEIKAGENKDKPNGNALKIPPQSLPALNRAQRVSESAAQAGFEWPDIEAVFTKIDEEISECREAIKNKDLNGISEEVGDVLFLIANLGRKTGINAEQALHDAIKKFDDRFSGMEVILNQSGQQLADLEFDALLDLWRKSKNNIRDKQGQSFTNRDQDNT